MAPAKAVLQLSRPQTIIGQKQHSELEEVHRPIANRKKPSCLLIHIFQIQVYSKRKTKKLWYCIYSEPSLPSFLSLWLFCPLPLSYFLPMNFKTHLFLQNSWLHHLLPLAAFPLGSRWAGTVFQINTLGFVCKRALNQADKASFRNTQATVSACPHTLRKEKSLRGCKLVNFKVLDQCTNVSFPTAQS